MVGAQARYLFEANGTEGAVRWNFERMNEFELHARRHRATPAGQG